MTFRSVINTLALNSGLAAVYFTLAHLGLMLAALNHSASPVWPATGFAFSIVFLFGLRTLPAVALGAFAANILTGGSLLSTFLITGGNTLEALVGALVIRHILAYRKRLELHTETIAFSVASVVGGLISSSIGVAALYFTGGLTQELIVPVWMTWWTGDVLGGLVVSPLLIQAREIKISRVQILHLGALSSLTALSTYFVFFNSAGEAYLFLLFPALLYAVRNLGRSHVLFVSAVVCGASIFATVQGVGPFAIGNLNDRLVHLQLFLAAFSLTSLVLSGFGRESLSRTPTFVLLFCWCISGLIFHSFHNSEIEKTEAHFNELVSDSEEKTSALLSSYEEVLRNGSGLFAASKKVDNKTWKSFQTLLDVTKRHPGMNGVGVIWPYHENEIHKLVQEMKVEGIPDFKVRSVQGATESSPQSLRYIIKYIEPAISNKRVLGLDVGSEFNRRTAADLARDSGTAAITSKIVLFNDQKKTPGFIYFFPIYKNGAALHSVKQRQAAHLGWIYSAIRYENLFSELFLQTSNEFELQVIEGKDPQALEKIVFNNFSKDFGQKHFEVEKTIHMGQQDFIFRWAKSPAFFSDHNTIVAWVGFCGALASLLLTNLMMAMQLLGSRSRSIAKELTKELSDSREKFQQGERRLLYALDGSNDGIWDWNVDKAEMYVSGKIAEIHGWPQLFQARSIKDFKVYAHPDDLKTMGDSIKRVMSGQAESHEVETRYRTLTGEYRWVLTRGKISERDANGVPKRMTGVHIDIHELKKAQSLLQETQYQLANIANSVPTKVSLWNKDLRCEFANDLYGNWVGIPGAKLTGQFIKDLLSPEDFSERAETLNKALRGENLRFENEAVRPSDLEKRFIITTYLPNENNGQRDGFFMFIQDITNLKKAELQAVEERKIAVEAANVKAQFLANMSHEIRTPLNGIIGMTNLIKATELNPQQKEYSEIILRSSDVLLNLINDILDFSKAEAGKLDLEVFDFNLSELVANVFESMRYSAAEKNIQLQNDLLSGGQQYFKGDPGRIRQVLTNLIGNAIKFTPHGTVTLGLLVQESMGRSFLKFEIRDTGIGIPSSAKSRMFKAFSQADATMSRRFGGSGLGLSICKQLVQLMGGEIGVESDEGHGSTFWFSLNLAHGQSEQRQIPAPIKQRATQARILIVEDNRVNQQIAVEILQNLGYATHAVGNGLEALEAIRESKFDLVLMDCQMPEMDGFEATRIIRQSESINLKNLPIVAMTANVFKVDEENCRAAGMNDYVSKPVHENELLRVIEKCLTENKKRSHILVVEDNKINQTVIGLNLEEMGYDFSVAENGVEALAYLSKNSYDLILMDCQMPEMDGFEATRQIRKLEDPAKSNIVIVALTANALKGDREKCLQAGMNEYLTKPVNTDELSKTLNHFLDIENRKAA